MLCVYTLLLCVEEAHLSLGGLREKVNGWPYGRLRKSAALTERDARGAPRPVRVRGEWSGCRSSWTTGRVDV
mgnify:CR=1 FL=1